MTASRPKRPWLKKKRTWAAGLVWLAVAYPLSIGPLCYAKPPVAYITSFGNNPTASISDQDDSVPNSASSPDRSAARAGMGAIPYDGGVAFRVWAPHAESASVGGDFNEWSSDAAPIVREDHDTWYGEVPEAKSGDEYRFLI